jgi:PAS domain S-box-containing protein
MIWPQTPYTHMFTIVSVVSILMGIYIWQHFRGPEAVLGTLIILASVEWTLVSVLQLGTVDFDSKLFWNKVKYVGMVLQPAVWVLFTFYYTRHEKWASLRNVTILSIAPVITLFLTFTNEYHGLIWSQTILDSEGSLLVLHHTYGMWFWALIAYSYLLIFFGSFLIIQMLIHYRSLFRWQSIILLIGALVPLAWSMLFLVDFNLYPHLEATPLNLPIMNVIVVFLLLYVRTMDIVPVAREIVMDSMSDSVIVLDSQNRVIDMNSSAQNLLGGPHLNFVGRNIESVWPGWGEQIDFEHWTEEDKEVVVEHDGELHIYDLRISALTGWRGDLVSRVIVIRDITERKKTEEEIRKFKTISDRAGYGSAIFDLEGNVIYANESFARMHGYTAEELIGKNLTILHNEEQLENVKKVHKKLMKKSAYTAEEIWHTRKDNTVFSALANGTLIRNGKGIPQFVAVTIIDITERKQAEEKIKTSLKEKEVLLREIHHRVKNNLQIVSSLLRLQSRHIKDKRYEEMLKESQNRIKSMALIHENLYKSENLANIDPKEYIRTLVDDLIQSYGVTQITSKIEVGDISLDIDIAIPCGLIINELVSNALKHAFPDKKGEITVSLRSNNENIELIVRDNGVGIPEDVDFRKTETLGLSLVSILAEGQLDGKITVTRDGGTAFYITFPFQDTAG